MRSRSALDVAGLAFGALAEALWCAALAAAIAGTSFIALTVFSLIVVLVAASLARSALKRWGETRGRVLALALIVAAAGGLLLADRAWVHAYPAWLAMQDGVFAGLLVFLGLRLGSTVQEPEEAVRRAIRCFALLCLVLLAAAASGGAAPWASASVAAELLAGGLLIAVTRYRAMTAVVDEEDRMPAWPWLIAVAGVVLGVIAAAALLREFLTLGAVQWALAWLFEVVRYLLLALAYIVGWALTLLMRGLEWVIAQVHLGEVPTQPLKPLVGEPSLRAVSPQTRGSGSALKLIVSTIVAVLAVMAAILLVVAGLRRSRRKTKAGGEVVEEREATVSLRTAARRYAGHAGRRLRRRLPGLHGREHLSPAGLVRRRYAELERRLTKSGRPRPAGATVRDHLAVCAGGDVSGEPAAAGEAAAPRPQAAAATAAELAEIYELARYSSRAVDRAQVDRFETLARGFGA